MSSNPPQLQRPNFFLPPHPNALPTTLPDRHPAVKHFELPDVVHTMKQDTTMLCKYTGKLCSLGQGPATKTDLVAVAKLAEKIASGLEKVFEFTRFESNRHFSQSKQAESLKSRCSRHTNCQRAKLAKRCYLCGTTDTPRWRNGFHHHQTLCNVCGLLETKRKTRLGRQRHASLSRSILS
ncbi:hypothetical protein B0I35DRAFT_437246 [Stachybotrys elegans]|uniref:GATA-type domain-containing protein n=1 Tax=Stachybotrys elegans TaxID=80388 RepID=A0A8K0SL16_9HYPO|nr:hypothetical protein B0I35DRAFT_437246 [Stachybotrys elegans]